MAPPADQASNQAPTFFYRASTVAMEVLSAFGFPRRRCSEPLVDLGSAGAARDAGLLLAGAGRFLADVDYRQHRIVAVYSVISDCRVSAGRGVEWSGEERPSVARSPDTAAAAATGGSRRPQLYGP